MNDLSRYSAVERLHDGRPLEVRALPPDDRDGMPATISHASDQSIRRRFLEAKRRFSQTEIDYGDAEGIRSVRVEHGQETRSGSGACHSVDARGCSPLIAARLSQSSHPSYRRAIPEPHTHTAVDVERDIAGGDDGS
ncbi:hypothetical protein [Methylobacterium nonmethylotrophicum]|uniref:Uncharacterized protein n=1 Tax=Methylobacterium nonmethylotrophicum TaxID=1141884 RepID=A0A4Z0NI10_9HYPH|nr:hypothetical protein [Methylobacterium nonmethylotrophicum]TGD95353.1 hypothetical protein EU555_28450 [Methylobacterium nonmethylotrophicum]